jgi:SAM-dependent methyltransferase
LRQRSEFARKSDWDQLPERLESRGHYLDEFLGDLKRRVYLGLIRRWGGSSRGRLLKTDLFEEAMGSDAILPDLADSHSQVVGIDASLSVVTRARRRVGPDRCACVVADVRHLPFADGSFDLIVSPSTLDHFRDPADLGRSLREIRKVLAPRALLIVTLDNRENLLDPLLRLAVRLRAVPYFIRSYRIRDLCRELEAAGMQVRDRTAILHNPRMVAVAAVKVAHLIGSQALIRLVRRALERAQSLEGTKWRYRSGSFVAALASPTATPDDAGYSGSS